ncbi:MAG: PorP/SprF family type IX secretion system membrane protein [Bacteroidota bacterium]
MQLNRILGVIVLLIFSWTDGQAQDFHYSQFYNAPVYTNPALTGVFDGDVRIQGNLRHQWSLTPVDYRTYSVMVDKKFLNRMYKSSFFAAGLGLNFDRAGDGELSWFDLNLNGSFTKYLSDGVFISLGGQARFAQRSFEEAGLRFADQFDRDRGVFNGNNLTSERFGNTSHGFLDLGIGLNFHWQTLDRYQRYDYKEERSKLDVGVALFHLTQPDQGFIEDTEVPIMRRLSLYARGVLQLGSDIDLAAGLTLQRQGPYRENVAMGGLRFHLNRKPGKQLALQGGIGYRWDEIGDAFFPTIQLHYNAWRVGLSYDVNISDFNIVTNRDGGPELSIRYIFKKVRPVPSRRFCPII